MAIFQEALEFRTRGRGTTEITEDLAEVVRAAHCEVGLCHVFLKHTSASLIFCENADSQVLRDLEVFMNKIVPDGDPSFLHNAEGPDDMPAHVRTVLTQNSLSIPIQNSRLDLGTWQGVYLWEHRFSAFHRHVTVTVIT